MLEKLLSEQFCLATSSKKWLLYCLVYNISPNCFLTPMSCANEAEWNI